MEEHRNSQRHRTFKGGTISFDRFAGIDCLVRNISDSGACLDVDTPVGIPEIFTLVIKPERVQRECQVVWRMPHKIGVRFLRKIPLPSVSQAV